ncbi:MAG: hypothetical protein EXS55_03610 [Candidatus Magasanikbacteria bacterium]|nr:hypothetical protein [Candidatus Magasanikbacteria bacterium]
MPEFSPCEICGQRHAPGPCPALVETAGDFDVAKIGRSIVAALRSERGKTSQIATAIKILEGLTPAQRDEILEQEESHREASRFIHSLESSMENAEAIVAFAKACGWWAGDYKDDMQTMFGDSIVNNFHNTSAKQFTKALDRIKKLTELFEFSPERIKRTMVGNIKFFMVGAEGGVGFEPSADGLLKAKALQEAFRIDPADVAIEFGLKEAIQYWLTGEDVLTIPSSALQELAGIQAKKIIEAGKKKLKDCLGGLLGEYGRDNAEEEIRNIPNYELSQADFDAVLKEFLDASIVPWEQADPAQLAQIDARQYYDDERNFNFLLQTIHRVFNLDKNHAGFKRLVQFIDFLRSKASQADARGSRGYSHRREHAAGDPSKTILGLLKANAGSAALDALSLNVDVKKELTADAEIQTAAHSCARHYIGRGLTDMAEQLGRNFNFTIAEALAGPEGEAALRAGLLDLLSRRADQALQLLNFAQVDFAKFSNDEELRAQFKRAIEANQERHVEVAEALKVKFSFWKE